MTQDETLHENLIKIYGGAAGGNLSHIPPNHHILDEIVKLTDAQVEWLSVQVEEMNNSADEQSPLTEDQVTYLRQRFANSFNKEMEKIIGGLDEQSD
jgi:hypothetical protein